MSTAGPGPSVILQVSAVRVEDRSSRPRRGTKRYGTFTKFSQSKVINKGRVGGIVS